MYTRHAVIATRIGELGDEVDAESDAFMSDVAAQFEQYLAGERTSFAIATAAVGDPFQERVWAILNEIPFGETMTYGEIAERLGSKALARKVGQAVGFNPLSIIVPCHRVVGKDGKLTGYAGGLTRKQLLLDLEEPATIKAERLF
jgi:methylated-DNA-[protein]-cysteine S-methyltransferase